jgi:hypothetical protein
LDDLSCAPAAKQVAFEQVLLTAASGIAHRCVSSGGPLELEQAFEHVDRRVEGGSDRSVLDLAVPATVIEPLAEDPIDDGSDVDAEVRPGLDRPAVDARLDLTVEVRLPGMLPPPVVGDERDRPTSRLRRRVESEELERLERVHRGRPRLPRFTAAVGRREARPARPQPVGILEREEPGTPPLVLHARPFGRHLLARGVREIVQHLPADGGIALEQPVDHLHEGTLTTARPEPLTAPARRLRMATTRAGAAGRRRQ